MKPDSRAIPRVRLEIVDERRRHCCCWNRAFASAGSGRGDLITVTTAKPSVPKTSPKDFVQRLHTNGCLHSTRSQEAAEACSARHSALQPISANATAQCDCNVKTQVQNLPAEAVTSWRRASRKIKVGRLCLPLLLQPTTRGSSHLQPSVLPLLIHGPREQRQSTLLYLPDRAN